MLSLIYTKARYNNKNCYCKRNLQPLRPSDINTLENTLSGVCKHFRQDMTVLPYGDTGQSKLRGIPNILYIIRYISTTQLR